MTLPEILRRPSRLPIVGAPMFIASGPRLVTAQCQAGVIGAFPALNARPTTLLDEWLHRIEEENAAYAAAHPDRTVAPFAVNQIVHRSNHRLDDDLATIVEHEAPIVITSLGARPEVNDAVHSYGGIVLHDVIDDRFARKAVEKGADGVIAVAAGAGGHAGVQSPFALVQEIRAWFDGPVLLSGAITHGRSILAALAAGADLAYVGSAFLATTEVDVVEDYKRMVVEASAADIVYTDLFTGVHGNYLRDSIAKAGLDPDNLDTSDPSTMNFGAGDTAGVAWRDIWGSGQGVGAVENVLPTADLIARLRREYEAALNELNTRTAALTQD